MKLRLELDVEFCHEDGCLEIGPDQENRLRAQLLRIADLAAGDGLITGELPFLANEWESRVVRLDF
jgi:hypothetical protein